MTAALIVVATLIVLALFGLAGEVLSVMYQESRRGRRARILKQIRGKRHRSR